MTFAIEFFFQTTSLTYSPFPKMLVSLTMFLSSGNQENYHPCYVPIWCDNTPCHISYYQSMEKV